MSAPGCGSQVGQVRATLIDVLGPGLSLRVQNRPGPAGGHCPPEANQPERQSRERQVHINQGERETGPKVSHGCSPITLRLP